jgi:hypothetical protein
MVQIPPHIWILAQLAASLTRQRRGEAEGVIAVALSVAGPVAADARPPAAAAWSACGEHWVAHGTLEQPACITPVQPLGPRCGRWRERGGEASPAGARPKSPWLFGWDPCDSPEGRLGCARITRLTLVQLAVGGQASVLLLASLLCLEVIELVPTPAGLVRKHHTWGMTESLGRVRRRGGRERGMRSVEERGGGRGGGGRKDAREEWGKCWEEALWETQERPDPS